ncbi:MAG: hypoxanthine phosphoribosyltransferase [Mycoplasmoidaceae bacterium]
MKKSYYSKVSEILISKEEINDGISRASKWVNNEYKDIDSPILLIGILKGCIPFLGQLITKLEIDVELDFMIVSSFKGTKSAIGIPEITKDITTNVKGKHILLVEDIIDSGYTIKYTIDKLKERQPASIKIITLLSKDGNRKVNLEPNYTCFSIPDKFIIGFGLDYKEKYRNYEFIGVLKKEFLD